MNNEVKITLTRNGRMWTNSNGEEEEVLDVIIGKLQIERGLCFSVFKQLLIGKLKIGESKQFWLTALD